MPLALFLDILLLIMLLYKLLTKFIGTHPPRVYHLLVNLQNLVADNVGLNVEKEHEEAANVEFIFEVLNLNDKVPDK